MVKKSVVCAAVVAAATCLVATSAQAAPADPHAGTLALLQRELGQAPGAAVYAGNANGSWSLAVGTGDFPGNVPIQADQHFRIASQTKTFTAAVVLQLVDEGKVDLDAPIERYLPGVVDGNGYDGNTITVRELLQQVSGIAANDSPNPQANPDGSYLLANVVKDGLSHKPAAAPGTTFNYSNTNYQILGLLIEKITGEAVGDAITTRIITPLGLTQTSFPKGGDRTLPAPFAHGYYGVTAGGVYFWYDATGSFEPSVFSSAGAMLSTESDLTTFYQALIDGKVVSAASLALMEQTVSMGSFAPPGYDYGLGLISHALTCGGTAWGHAGNVIGYASWTAVTSDGRYATVVANDEVAATGDNGDDLRFEILNSALCDS